jgi:DNA-3-methyladenine glycosylase II
VTLTGTPQAFREGALALHDRDPELGAIIDAVGPLTFKLADDRFAELAASIVSQQLSVKAADTIWGRFKALGPVTPEAVLGLAEEELRGAGLSGAKARYVRDLAGHVADGQLDLVAIDDFDDEALIEALTQVKGIGRWTAEMYLIFALGRMDVLALDDLGLRRAGGWLLGHERPATREELAEAGERWSPYRSVASRYLWASLNNKPAGAP